MLRESRSRQTFVVFNTLLMLGLVFLTLYPFYYILMASFSNNNLIAKDPGILFWPKGFNMGAYALTFRHPLLLSGYMNILLILATALPINLLLTVFCAYVLAAKDLLYKKQIYAFVLFTMFFSGGMIPIYLNINSLGLINSRWALIIPGALSIYNAIIVRTAIDGLPESLIESAYIDGANDVTILFRIVVPLLKPTLAVILLYYAVGHWNSWFPASLYIQDNQKLPIQAIMRAILIENERLLQNEVVLGDEVNSYAESIKYALVIIGTAPILTVYPFLQKYFVKGVMIGAVKG